MAQVLKLKRTAVNGKTPTTSNLELGEMAMNTFDGRIFLKKDSGIPVVNEILTTNTEGSITGSLNLNGNITASNLTLSGNAIIDGNITLGGNITIGDNIADVITVTAGFSGSLIPDATAQYDLGSSTKKWNTLHVVTASADYFIGDGSQLTNVVAEVSQVATVTASFNNQDDITINHNFNSRNIHVSVYDNSYQLIIPETVELISVNSVNVTLSTPLSGHIVVSKGGHIVTGSVSERASVTSSFIDTDSISVIHGFESRNIHVSVYDSEHELIIPESIKLTTPNQINVELQSNTTGYVVVAKGGHLLEGERPVSQETTVTSSFDSQTSVTVAHNFDSKNVIVTVYDGSDNQIIPDNVSLLNNNSVKVDFVSSQSGFIVVAKGGHVVQGTTSNTTNLNGQPASYYLNYNNFTNIPSGLVSGSSQLTSSYDLRYVLSGSIGGGSTDISSLNTFTQSIDSRVTTLESATGSYLTSLNGTISGSDQLTSSLDLRYAPSASYLTSLNGAISSSSQILYGSGIFSGSFNDIPQNPFVSASNAISTSGHLVPDTSEVYDLGSPTQRWRDLYLSGSTIDLGGTLITSDTNGDVNFKDSQTQNLKKIVVEELQIGTGETARKIKVDNGIITFTDINNVDKVDESLSLPNGTLSGSSQVDLTQTTNYESGIKTKLNTEEVLSGSILINLEGTGVLSSSIDFITYSSSIDSRILTLENKTDNTGSDNQTLSFNQLTNILSLSRGNSVDLTSLFTGEGSGGSSIWLTGSNYYFVNADLQVTGSFSATSLTGSLNYSNITNVPSGLVSSSQQIIGGSGIVSGSVLRTLDGTGVLSGSKTDITQLNQFTQSIQSEVNSLTAATSSYLTSLPSGLVSGSSQVSDLVNPFNSYTSSIEQKFQALGFVTSGLDGRVTSLENFSTSLDQTYATDLELLSATQSLISNVISSKLDSSVYSSDSSSFDSRINNISTQISFDEITNKPTLVSGSSQISFNGIVDKPTLISGSSQISFNGIVDKPTLISGSSQISLSGFSTTNLSEGTNLYYTDVRVKTKLNTEGVISGSSQVDYNSIQNKPTIPSSITDLNISDGTNGQVLTTNGSGTFSFQTPSGGSGDTGDITFSNSTIDTDNSSDIIITPSVTMSADLKIEGTLEVDSFVSRGVGSAKIEAGANLELTAGNVVVITSSPLRLASFTTTERNALAAQNGDLIYNTTLNKLQGYQSGSWINIDGT